jgi:hypothetical protein
MQGRCGYCLLGCRACRCHRGAVGRPRRRWAAGGAPHSRRKDARSLAANARESRIFQEGGRRERVVGTRGQRSGGYRGACIHPIECPKNTRGRFRGRFSRLASQTRSNWKDVPSKLKVETNNQFGDLVLLHGGSTDSLDSGCQVHVELTCLWALSIPLVLSQRRRYKDDKDAALESAWRVRGVVRDITCFSTISGSERARASPKPVRSFLARSGHKRQPSLVTTLPTSAPVNGGNDLVGRSRSSHRSATHIS